MHVFRRNSSLAAVSATTVLAFCAMLSACPATAQDAAQHSQPEAEQAIRSAVASEMQANETDKSIWRYTDIDNTPGKNAVYHTIETRQGTLRRMVELNGQFLDATATQAETQRIDDYVGNSAAQARARKSGAHDDAQAAELLKMLPEAFLWTIASQTPEYITLNYSPNPRFSPPDMQSRVMGEMSGEMIIARSGDRIRTLRGTLTSEVLIGWGILGKLYKGGTFDIERRMVGEGHWQITETHVHIGGHALVFKSIGQQEDEVKTDWRPSPCDTLKEAVQILEPGK